MAPNTLKLLSDPRVKLGKEIVGMRRMKTADGETVSFLFYFFLKYMPERLQIHWYVK